MFQWYDLLTIYLCFTEIYTYNLRLKIPNNDTTLTDSLLTQQLLNSIERMIMQSDIRDVYHAIEINEYRSIGADDNLDQQNSVANFILQVKLI